LEVKKKKERVLPFFSASTTSQHNLNCRDEANMKESLSRWLLFLTLSRILHAVTTALYEYDLEDSSTSSAYPQGDKEHHCFDINDGDKIYVRGTYGHFGYFEGAVSEADPQVFYVNWYENADGSLTPTSGSAILNYSTSFDEVTGPFWNNGVSDFRGSFSNWHSTGGSFFMDDSTIAGRTAILARCLYPGAAHAIARADIAALNGSTAITGESLQGENTLCFMPAGPEGGSWLGAYTYVFDEDDLGGEEKGNYGTNPFAFWGKSGMGFVGTFHASTGPGPGTVGPNIYMIVADSAKAYWVGFYCNVDTDLVRTMCYTEYYEVTTVNYNANDCPRYYRLDGTLDPLYEFAAIGSSDSDAENSQVAVVFAIVFGCLSGVLALVIVYLSYPARKPQPVVVIAG
jgi:hypothetical protein